MKKGLANLRDTLVAGLLFMLPILIIFVLLTKVFTMLTGLSSRIAGMFGMKSIVGVSGGTVVSGVLFILLCLLFGYLMRLSFVKMMNNYLDTKLMKYIPGYKTYRDQARNKLDPHEESLPFQSAAWIAEDERSLQPGFVLENLPEQKCLVFIPTAGNVKEGRLLLLSADKVFAKPQTDIKSFYNAINKQGIGIEK